MDDWEDVAASLPEYQQELVYECSLPESLAERDRRNRNVGYAAGIKACKITVEQLEWELARAQERVGSLSLALAAHKRKLEAAEERVAHADLHGTEALAEWVRYRSCHHPPPLPSPLPSPLSYGRLGPSREQVLDGASLDASSEP